ncbi:MAG: radical SAM protein [Tumebacillaceae bacterium]
MKRSRYVINAPSFDGKSKIFYNLRNGLGIKVPTNILNSFEQLAETANLKEIMQKHDFFHHPDEADHVLMEYKQLKDDSNFHLIILPHQNCNFRCVYCYEKFEKNKMEPEVEQGIISLVEERLSSGKHQLFTVSWFGGEPLLASDVIERLSAKFTEICEKYQVRYIASLTSNGYFLDEKTSEMLLRYNVSVFQITLDGIKDCHDHQRMLKGGQPTYDRIVENLTALSQRPEPFQMLVRMNVGADNLVYVEPFIREMKERFGHDERFRLYFHNIGQWGGPNDADLNICSESVAVSLTSLVLDNEMKAYSIFNKIRPNRTCYASSQNSFVIGVDGMVYKCTVALYDERNHVGRLTTNGQLELHEERMKLWTDAGVEDSGCKNCFFAPSCHGDSCPLVRLEEQGKRPCPDEKTQVREVLTMMDRQGHKFVEIKTEAMLSSS